MELMASERSSTVMIYPEEAFAGATVTENADGSKTVEFTPDNEILSICFNDTLQQLFATYEQMGAADMNYAFSSARLVMTISDDGYILHSETELVMKLDMTISGYATSSISQIHTMSDYIDPGSPVTIEFPE